MSWGEDMTRVTDLARRHARRMSLFGVVGISGVVPIALAIVGVQPSRVIMYFCDVMFLSLLGFALLGAFLVAARQNSAALPARVS